jgi:hypothetical protein
MKYPTPYAAAHPTTPADAGAQSLARSSTAPSLRPAMGLTGTVAPSSPAKISAAAFVVKRGPSIRPSPGVGASSPLRSPVPTQAVEQRGRVVDGAAAKRESQLQFSNMGYRPSTSPRHHLFFYIRAGSGTLFSFSSPFRATTCSVVHLRLSLCWFYICTPGQAGLGLGLA